MTHPSIKNEMQARGRRRAAPSPDAIAFTIKDAQSLGAPSRSKIYTLAKAGRLKLLKVDSRTLVDGDSLRILLKGGNRDNASEPIYPTRTPL